ncbi:MAG: Fe-S protein assembly chaperone HscA [Phycisphaerales bacterium]
MSASAAPTDRHRAAVPNDPIVGIDLGTTNSLVAYCFESGPRVLGGGSGGAIVPSVVRFHPDGVVTVGDAPRRGRGAFASETVASAKRLMGRSARETAEFARAFSVPVVEGPRGIAAFSIAGRIVTPHEVAAEVLRELRAVAEADLGTAVRRAVITVPAYFDDAQRQATRDAARLAGLEAVRIVNEPTAAALAYGLGQNRRAERIAVYDLGGGTFDVTVLDIVPGEDAGTGADCFQVLATAGDTALGGDDVDRAIARRWIETDASLLGGDHDRAALVEAAERAKVALSESDTVRVEAVVSSGIRALTLSRAELDEVCAPLVARTLDACARALRDAQSTAAEVDRVVLVGGSTRLASVRAAVARFFAKEPYAALDPDRVVALGAAVQAAIVAGGRRDLLLLDVIPLSLGIETVGGTMAKLIMRNSPMPARAHEKFSTSKDGQTSVRIHVLQGERELAEHCRSLGTFDLRGIPPMPAGIPQIEVAFTVDQNGVLAVTAVEKRSAREASIQVVPSYGLTHDEVERIERESLEHARADMTIHRVIDLRVHSELDLKWIGEALARVRTTLEPAYVAELEQAMADVRTRCEAAARDPRSVEPNAFNAAKQALDRLSMKVHETAIAETLRR